MLQNDHVSEMFPHARQLLVLLATHTVLLIACAWTDGPTLNEPDLLRAGLAHWLDGDFSHSHVTPPLSRLLATFPVVVFAKLKEATALLNPKSHFNGARMWQEAPEHCMLALRLARLTLIPFSILGMYICYKWAFALHGPEAGMLSAALWAFSPDILGHGHLITTDQTGTTLCVLLFWCVRRWLLLARFWDAILCGVVMGALQATKGTYLILYPLLVMTFIWWPLACPSAPSCRQSLPHRGAQLLLACVISLAILGATYGFNEMGCSIADLKLKSELVNGSLGPDISKWIRGPLQHLPLPVPAEYVRGLDHQRTAFERGLPSYLAGEWRNGGWWYYFCYGAIVKSPCGVLLLILWSVAAMVTSVKNTRYIHEYLLILAPMVSIFLFVSAHTGFNKSMRYVLPCYPFVFIFVSHLARPSQIARRIPRRAIVVLIMASAISVAWVFPHTLSYFNEAAGGPLCGDRHLLHSNIDWGQDILYLRRWLHSFPVPVSLRLAYHGGVDPASLGIDYRLPNTFAALHTDLRHGTTANAEDDTITVVSLNLLRGHRGYIQLGGQSPVFTSADDFKYLLESRPIRRIGYSLLVFGGPPDSRTPPRP